MRARVSPVLLLVAGISVVFGVFATSANAKTGNPNDTVTSSSHTFNALATKGTVKFAAKSAKLTKASKAKIRSIVAANPKNSHYVVTGYVQLVGSDKNTTLSIRRANAVKTYLKALGVTGTIDTAKGKLPRSKAKLASARKAVISAEPAYDFVYSGNGNSAGAVPIDGSSPYYSSKIATVLGNVGSPALSKTGYHFTGWNTKADGSGTSYVPGAQIVMSANVQLFAQWALDVYTVTYDDNDATGGSAPSAQTYTYGDAALTVPGDSGLTFSSYTFMGWSATGDLPALGATYTPTADVTLYAIWQGTITYDINGGTDSPPSAETFIYGASNSVDLPSSSGTAPSNFAFEGWGESSGSLSAVSDPFDASSDADGAITLYSIWSQVVSFDMNGGSGTEGDMTCYYPCSAGLSLPTSSDVTGKEPTPYTFVGWGTTDSATSATSATYFPTAAETTLYAIWKIDVVFSLNNGSATGAAPSTISHYYNDGNIDLPDEGVAPDFDLSGYQFQGWGTNSADAVADMVSDSYDPSSDATSGSVTLYAIWTKVVSFDVNGGQSSDPSDVYIYPTDSGVATLPSAGTSPTGFNFDGWATTNNATTSDASDGYSPSSATQTLYAIWSVTVSFDGNGSSDSDPSDQKYYYSAASGLDIPDSQGNGPAGFTFKGWSTDGQMSGVTEPYVPSGDTALKAIWAITVSYDVTNASSGSAPSSSYLYYGDTDVTLAAKSGFDKSNWTDAGWSTDSTAANKVADFGGTYTPTGDITLYATWKVTVSFNNNGGNGSTPDVPYNGTAVDLIDAGPSVIFTKDSTSGPKYWEFDGWSTDGTSANKVSDPFTPTTASSGNVELKAVWAQVYKVTYSANGSDVAMPEPQYLRPGYQTIRCIEISAQYPSRKGYRWLSRWSRSTTQSLNPVDNCQQTLISTNITLYPQWQANVYQVYYHANSDVCEYARAAGSVANCPSDFSGGTDWWDTTNPADPGNSAYFRTYIWEDFIDADFTHALNFGSGASTAGYQWATTSAWGTMLNGDETLLAKPTDEIPGFSVSDVADPYNDQTIHMYPWPLVTANVSYAPSTDMCTQGDGTAVSCPDLSGVTDATDYYLGERVTLQYPNLVFGTDDPSDMYKWASTAKYNKDSLDNDVTTLFHGASDVFALYKDTTLYLSKAYEITYEMYSDLCPNPCTSHAPVVDSHLYSFREAAKIIFPQVNMYPLNNGASNYLWANQKNYVFPLESNTYGAVNPWSDPAYDNALYYDFVMTRDVKLYLWPYVSLPGFPYPYP